MCWPPSATMQSEAMRRSGAHDAGTSAGARNTDEEATDVDGGWGHDPHLRRVASSRRADRPADAAFDGRERHQAADNRRLVGHYLRTGSARQLAASDGQHGPAAGV